MDFDDYVTFLRKLLDEDLTEGRLTEESLRDVCGRESVQQLRECGYPINVRDPSKIGGGGMAYISMDLESRTTSVYYFDNLIWHGTKHHENIPEIFQGNDNPFLKHETISFMGRFGRGLVPLVNVAEFFYLTKREHDLEPVDRGILGGIYAGVKYSSHGAQEIITPPGKFSM